MSGSGAVVREALGPLATHVETTLADLDLGRVVERIWARDPGVWGKGPVEVLDRLGWLTVPEEMQAHLGELAVFGREVREAGFRDVVLLGMGGSSLGAEVLRTGFNPAEGAPRFSVLDSTVPAWVSALRARLDPASTLFLVGSKSGTTAEITAFFRYFWAEVEAAVGAEVGTHFVAITDPGTALASEARERRFRRIFENPAEIGGRFSVLSLFGLVPAACLGLDLERFLGRAVAVARASGTACPAPQNLGARLGAILGAAWSAGRDKATLLTSERLAAFGLWAEQLVAESTGKDGKGILPIAGEPWGAPGAYRQDRLFLALRLAGEDNAALDYELRALEAAGHPVVIFDLADEYDLAGEFFRWQFATAVAGHLLGVHPFDQPDVESAKRITKALLAAYKATGELGAADPGPSLARALAETRPEFVAFMAYLGASPALEQRVEALRRALLEGHGIASTFGYAPRMLHSTGQYHKGGPNTGLFVQLIPRDEGAGPALPGEPYGFGVLARAQALGDAGALREKGRTLVRLAVSAEAAELTANLLT